MNAPVGTDRPRLYLWWIAATALVSALGAAYWTRQREPRYEAECLLEYGREPGTLASGAADALSSEEWYRTQDFLLTSTSIATRVVDELRLDRAFLAPKVGPSLLEPRTRNNSEQASADALEMLRANLAVGRVEGTHLVRIKFEDSDPKRAALIANTVAEVYLRKSLEDRTASTERAVTWLSEQIDATNSRLTRTEGELQTYFEHKQAPALPLPERQAMLTDEIKSLNQRLVDARVHRIELAARLAKLRAAAQNPNPFEVHADEIDENDQVRQLRTDYLALVIRQRELAATRRAPSAKRTEQLTADAEGADRTAAGAELADHVATDGDGLHGDGRDAGQTKLTALWEAMQAAIAGVARSAQAELNAAQQVEAQLQATLEKANATGRELQQQQLEYNRLERERSEAETFLKALRERSATAGLAAATGIWNAKVVEPAIPPPHPAALPLVLNAGLGAILGSLLAVNLALLLRFFRPAARPSVNASSATAIGDCEAAP